MHRLIVTTLMATLLGVSLGACSTREMLTGAGAGAAAYEYSNNRAMDQLKEDHDEGRISTEEYERRKEEIDDRSLLY
jgi:uncharacterized membrane protein